MAHRKIHVKPDGSVEIQHFDIGGTVASGVNTISQPGLSAATGIVAPVGQAVNGIAQDLTTQDQFQATAPNISTQEGNYNSANAGQNALAQALTAQANGSGPNPALAQLNQTSAANANEAAGLAASQRGLNPGEAARLGTEAQVSANQNAAGQAAALNAQQQLAAEQGLESVYGQQENAASQNASVVNQGQLGAEGINAQTAALNTNADNTTSGGLLSGVSGALGLGSLFAKGGVVKKTENPKLSTVPKADRFKGNLYPSHLKAVADIYHGQHFDWGGSVQALPLATVNIPELPSPRSKSSSGSGKSGVTPGTSSFSPDFSSATEGNNFGASELTMPEMGSQFSAAPAAASLLSKGGKVGGKPKVDHDAYKNDTVDAKLTPGEVVIDLDTLHDKGPMGDAARMLAQHIESKKQEKGGDHEDDFREALKRAVAGRKSK